MMKSKTVGYARVEIKYLVPRIIAVAVTKGNLPLRTRDDLDSVIVRLVLDS